MNYFSKCLHWFWGSIQPVIALVPWIRSAGVRQLEREGWTFISMPSWKRGAVPAHTETVLSLSLLNVVGLNAFLKLKITVPFVIHWTCNAYFSKKSYSCSINPLNSSLISLVWDPWKKTHYLHFEWISSRAEKLLYVPTLSIRSLCFV